MLRKHKRILMYLTGDGMKTEFVQEIKVLSTQTDHTTRVGLLQGVSLLQDNMCEYFKNISCDGPTILPSHNCFFVLAKTKLRFIESPKWLQKIILKSDVSRLTKLRVNICHNICDMENKLMIEGLQELCPMDMDTRKPRLINTTPFPADVEINNSYTTTLEFEKFDEELSYDNLVEKIKVNTNNIDYYGHTNNIEYVKFIISTIPSSEFYKMKFKTFEIHYIQESKERDVLDVYCKKSKDNYYFEIKNGNNIVCKAKIEFDIDA